MKHPIRPAAVPILAAAIALISGCATLEMGSGSERFGVRPSGETPFERLDWAESALRRTPNEPGLYLIRAEESLRLAQAETDPSERQPWYAEMRLALDEFQLIAEARRSAWHPQRDSLLGEAWSTETAPVREAAEAGGFPEQVEPDRAQRLLAHLRNARVVSPDSLSAYSRAAQLLYAQGNLLEATIVLEQGLERTGAAPFDYMEKLAYLYAESGEWSGALAIYGELTAREADREEQAPLPGREEWMRRKRVRSAHANTLMLAGQHSEALDVLRALHRDFPQDDVIRRALVSELLYTLETESARLEESLERLQVEGDPADEAERSSIDRLRRAFGELELVLRSGDELLRLLHGGADAGRASMAPVREEVVGEMARRFNRLSDRMLSSADQLRGDQAPVDAPASQAMLELRYRLLNLGLPLWESMLDEGSDPALARLTLAEVYEDLGLLEQAEELRASGGY